LFLATTTENVQTAEVGGLKEAVVCGLRSASTTAPPPRSEFNLTAKEGVPLSLLIVPCPTCNFQLMLADQNLLGRPARCPQCQTKFVLEEKQQPDDSADILNSIGSIVLGSSSDAVLDPKKLRAEDGRTCITIPQLKTCHSTDEVAQFVRWINQSGKSVPRSEGCYFLSDYADWCDSEMPDD
jgi:hypothetical protein